MELLSYSIEDAELSRCLFNEANDAFIIFEPTSHRILEVNPATQRISGFRKNELLSMTLDQLLMSKTSIDYDKFLTACHTTCFFHSEEGYRLICNTGDAFDINISVSRIHVEPDPLGLLVVRDVSKRRIAEELVAKQRMSLEHASRLSAAGMLVAGISHQLFQPLSVISNYAGAIRVKSEAGKIDPDMISPWIEIISNQSQRAAEIVRCLRNFVKKRNSQWENCNLNQLIQETVALVETEFSRHQIAVHLELPTKTSTVCIERVQIQQVFVNLLQNAFQAVEDAQDRVIIISSSESKRGDTSVALVRVTDFGCGVSPEVRDSIFESFCTTKSDGLGLGLSISRTIVEAHGGQLWLDDTDETATTFSFFIPISTPPSKPESETD